MRRINNFLLGAVLATAAMLLTSADAGVTAISAGGTGARLAYPAGDRLFGYSDSDGAGEWVEAGPGLTLSSGTLATSGLGAVRYAGLSASAAHLGTTTAATTVMPATAEGSATIGTGDLSAGSIINYDVRVSFDGDADGDETLTVNLLLGAQLIATSGAVAVDAVGLIDFSGSVKIRSSSASGTGYARGTVLADGTPASTGGAFSSFDCTAAKAFIVQLDWGGTTDAADTASTQEVNLTVNNFD